MTQRDHAMVVAVGSVTERLRQALVKFTNEMQPASRNGSTVDPKHFLKAFKSLASVWYAASPRTGSGGVRDSALACTAHRARSIVTARVGTAATAT